MGRLCTIFATLQETTAKHHDGTLSAKQDLCVEWGGVGGTGL